MPPPASDPPEDEPTVADVLREFRKAVDGLAAEFRGAVDEWQEEAQYRFDKELGKQLAKHPELYAELKRGYRQFRRDLDRFAKDWGLR